MARKYLEGFEGGNSGEIDIPNFSGVQVNVVPNTDIEAIHVDPPPKGNYCLFSQTSGSYYGYFYVPVYKFMADSTEIYFKFRFYCSELAYTACKFDFSMYHLETDLSTTYLGKAGSSLLSGAIPYWGVASTNPFGGFAIGTEPLISEAYNVVETHMKMEDHVPYPNFYGKTRINGVYDLDWSWTGVTEIETIDILKVTLNFNSLVNAFFIFDDFVFGDSVDDFSDDPNAWTSSIIRYIPTSGGTENWTPSVTGADDYTMVDQLGTKEEQDNDYIYTSTSLSNESFPVIQAGTDTYDNIQCLQTNYRVANSIHTLLPTIQPYVDVDGSFYFVASWVDWTNLFVVMAPIFEVNPDTSLAWTQSQIENSSYFKVGIRGVSS